MLEYCVACYLMERRDILTNYGHMFRAISCALGQRMNQALSGMELPISWAQIGVMMMFLASGSTMGPPADRL